MHGPARRRHRGTPRAPIHAGEAAYRAGLQHSKDGRWQEAGAAFEQAVARSPSDHVYWLNLAHARMRCGRFDDGAEAALRGAELAPASDRALAVAFECLNAANRHGDTIALASGRDLTGIGDHHFHFQIGQAFYVRDQNREAADCYLAALSRKPDFAAAHVQLGNAFNRLKMHEEARECYKTAIAVGAEPVCLTSGMAFEDAYACRWDHLAEDLPAMLRLMEAGAGHPEPFPLLAQPSTRAQQLAAARAFAQRRFGGIEPLRASRSSAPSSRLRVGYLSNDFVEHATAYLITQIFELHDRQRFEVTAYSYGVDDRSPARRRIEQAVDRFVDVRELSDRATAERIRDDGIDVLVDLKGYTMGARNGVLAFRPSPVQVNYLGYPGTLGAPFYDYIVGDPTVTPLEHGADYSEKIAQMPACYQPNDRSRAIGPRPSRAECGLPETGFVFCSFNNLYKIRPEMFDIWCRLLQQVADSVLWLYESNEQARRNLVREAQQRGIETSRLVWAPQMRLAQHLGRLQLADLVLDSRPYGAHTTASDALWAGVPVLTCPGGTFASCVAASLLKAVGLPELIAPDLRHYESMALELARDARGLAALKQRLAHNREHCALFDSVRYTRDLESLYQRMYDRHRRGEAPCDLPAQPSRAAQ